MSDHLQSSIPPPASGRWRRWRGFIVPLVLVAIAATQMVRVQFDGLNSWRGGGFGMYAGFHPSHNDAWLIRTDTGETYRYERTGRLSTGPFADLIEPNLTYVNERRLERVFEQLPDDWRAVSVLQVWTLDFDPESGDLTRRLLVEVGNP